MCRVTASVELDSSSRRSRARALPGSVFKPHIFLENKFFNPQPSPLQSTVFIAVRYALATDADLARIAGIPENSPNITSTIEEHLVHVAFRLLHISPE